MKNLSSLLVAVALFVLTAAAASGQTSVGTLDVSANVFAQCAVSATPLDFGSAFGGSFVDAQSTITVNCNNGIPYQIALDAGTHASPTTRDLLGTTAGATIDYELYSDAARTIIWGDNGTTGSTYTSGDPVSGTGSSIDQANTVFARTQDLGPSPVPDSYSDTITVSIWF